MKILHLYKDFYPPVMGGIERHVSLMCRFQQSTHQVDALVCSGRIFGRTRTVDGVHVREAGEWGRLQGAPVSPTFPLRLRQMHPDVAVIQTPNPTAEISALLARPNRYVVRYQSDIVRQRGAMRMYAKTFERYLDSSHAIIASSSRYIDTSPYLAQRKARCHVIPLGIVPENYDDPSEARIETIRERYGGAFVFTCGRHVYYKGLEYLIEAASEIAVTVVIAGAGPMTMQHQDQAGRTRGRVRFAGVLSDQELIDHLHACTVFAFPSVERSEAFGVAMLEAQACAKPVVATTLGTGVEHVNLDGATGINVPPRDAAAISRAINRLLRNPAQAAEYGEAARERVRREFDARDVAQAELELYQSIL